jgi:hypothetical protein
MNITKITTSRLYNLGNYEHVRYEITVDVGADESAEQAFRALDLVLARLKPDRMMPTKQEIEREELRIVRMRTMTDDEWSSEYGHAVGTRDEIIARYEVDLAGKKQRRAKSIADRDRAYAALKDLGGVEVHTDAKDHWQD